MFIAWLIGLAFGFFGSMPIAGPTAVVLVSKGLGNEVRSGIYIAAGAAAAESVYAFMAFWGLTAVLSRYPVLLPASRLVGAVLLFGLGLHFVTRKGKAPETLAVASAQTTGTGGIPRRLAYRNVLFGLSLTAVNPTLLVTWTAAVSAAHAMGALRVWALDAFPFATGAAGGIVGWFARFLWLLARFRSRVKPEAIDRFIRWMGGVLIVAGIGLAIRAVSQWP